MTNASSLFESIEGISSRISDDMSERDVEVAFLDEDFFRTLGYGGAGVDLRSEFTLPDNKRPDYVTLDNNEAVTAVYEFKQTGRDLGEHKGQLFGYMSQLRADYGVLTNGELLRLYRRGEDRRILQVSFESVSESKVRDLFDKLRKREFDLTDTEKVDQYIEQLDPIPLDKEAELGQRHFFDTFRLEEGSPFAELVTGMMDILEKLRDEKEAKFVKGAYDFWEATYADIPDEEDRPSSWEPFIDEEQSIEDFMFCLETGHAVLSRLLLSKAAEDHGFFEGTGYQGMAGYFKNLGGFSDTINPDTFPVTSRNLIDKMEQDLVQSLFQDDIFIWWEEAYKEQISRGFENIENQVKGIAASDDSSIEVTDEIRELRATRERLSKAIAKLYLNILRFDFCDVEGDLLGDLYQKYFDPKTRKALGEFYTPQPVVEYIMDGVGYERGVSNERLIDPACGSGTFLVEAVERYLEDVQHYEDDPNWREHIEQLCTTPHVVGLDIHPFAVLMAQIRFVTAILPAYREAKEENPDFTIKRLPIYRTDTLRNERKISGADIKQKEGGSRQSGLDVWQEGENDVKIPVPLPVEVSEEGDIETENGFLVQYARMPLYETVTTRTDIDSFGEYFSALQGVLDNVRKHMEMYGDTAGWDWTYDAGLEGDINRYTSREYDDVEEFFERYVDDMLENVRYLQKEHDDGRLFKMFEDTILSLVVKNYMEYEYVVGNPPYVRVQNLPDEQKAYLNEIYESTTGNYDIYCPFYERGFDWLTEGTGKLGYITPNQFMVTDYGEGLRRFMLENVRLNEVYDFRDSGVFADATNYPLILIAEDEAGKQERDRNEIRSVRVKANVDEESGMELDDAIIDAVRGHRGEPGYSDDYIDVFDFPQGELDEGYWSLMPPEELEVFRKLENEGNKRIEDITDAVFQGIRTSANDIYIVDIIDADRVKSDDTGDVVTVSPIGEDDTYEIETDLLRPFLEGDEVKRWRGDWDGLHVVHPYYAEETDEGASDVGLYSQEHLQENLPLTWDFFLAHKEDLEARESGRKEGEEDWYGYIYPKNLDKFENPKIIQAEIAEKATYMIDESGTWYFTTGYGVTLNSDHRRQTVEIASELNSKALDFYLKHIAAVKAGGFYSYRTQYVEKLPCIIRDNSGEFDMMREKADEITATIDLSNKTSRFPSAYLGDYTGELEYVDYEWQTRRYPVDADVQGNKDGEFMVQAGRSDIINDPAMYSDDREARKMRARYVCEAVNGRNVKSGEETTIPIPHSDDGVEELLDALEEDRREVESTDIDALEAKIDEAAYDLFGLEEQEREIIEEYLEVF